MKTINVVAAVIVHDGKVFATHRGGAFAFAGAFGGEVARRGEPSLGRLAARRHRSR